MAGPGPPQQLQQKWAEHFSSRLETRKVEKGIIFSTFSTHWNNTLGPYGLDLLVILENQLNGTGMDYLGWLMSATLFKPMLLVTWNCFILVQPSPRITPLFIKKYLCIIYMF